MSALSLPVIPLTITVSLCLVFTFVLFFLREQTRRISNAERESLLPLAEETPRLAGRPAPSAALDDEEIHHACSCRPRRPVPCQGCEKRVSPPPVS